MSNSQHSTPQMGVLLALATTTLEQNVWQCALPTLLTMRSIWYLGMGQLLQVAPNQATQSWDVEAMQIIPTSKGLRNSPQQASLLQDPLVSATTANRSNVMLSAAS